MNPLKTIAQWLTDYRTYIGAIYSFLAFPLGMMYFIALIFGLVAGTALSITLIGIPLLMLTLYLARLVARMEGQTARAVLGADIPAFGTLPRYEGGMIDRAKQMVTDGDTWRSVAYLFLKFPMGVLSFVMVVLTGGGIGAAIVTPLYYEDPNRVNVELLGSAVDTLPEALLTSLMALGIALLGLGGIRLFNVIWRKLAELMLVPRNRERDDINAVLEKAKRTPKRAAHYDNDDNAQRLGELMPDTATINAEQSPQVSRQQQRR